MDRALMDRRSWLMTLGGALVCASTTRAWALGRRPTGGTLMLMVPHDTATLDPFDLSDPMAAIFGPSVFEPVYRIDPRGNPYPSLAETLPQRQGGRTIVALREGLRSGRGRPLDARDLLASVEKARALGAAAVLASVPRPQVSKANARVAVFGDIDPAALAHALASPLACLTARTSTPAAPDGTGALRVEPGQERMTLVRNEHAARGASFLDRVEVLRAADMAEPLRAFEAGRADIGWLGAGLFQPRTQSVAFDLGLAAWVVLRTGSEAGSWHAPGVAQGVIDAIPPARLAHLALGPMAEASGRLGWGGPAGTVVAPARSARLLPVARTLASLLSREGHELTALPVAQPELLRRRSSGSFCLMIDIVRPVGPPGLATLLALATADDVTRATAVARHPPRLTSYSPRALARTLRLGVLGELRIAGSRLPSVHVATLPEGHGWDLGATFKTT